MKEGMEKTKKELEKVYDEHLRNLNTLKKAFSEKVQDIVLLYFILMPNDYNMAIDKWSKDADYENSLIKECEKIDKDFHEAD